MFASETSTTITIPRTEGQTATIRKLSRRDLLRVLDLPDTQWWRAFILGLPDTKEGDTVTAPAVAPGLIGWSCGKPITADVIDDLDFDASEFIGSEILYLAKPSLRPKADAGDEQKKADGVSPVSQ